MALYSAYFRHRYIQYLLCLRYAHIVYFGGFSAVCALIIFCACIIESMTAVPVGITSAGVPASVLWMPFVFILIPYLAYMSRALITEILLNALIILVFLVAVYILQTIRRIERKRVNVHRTISYVFIIILHDKVETCTERITSSTS